MGFEPTGKELVRGADDNDVALSGGPGRCGCGGAIVYEHEHAERYAGADRLVRPTNPECDGADA